MVRLFSKGWLWLCWFWQRRRCGVVWVSKVWGFWLILDWVYWHLGFWRRRPIWVRLGRRFVRLIWLVFWLWFQLVWRLRIQLRIVELWWWFIVFWFCWRLFFVLFVVEELMQSFDLFIIFFWVLQVLGQLAFILPLPQN